MRTGRAVAVTLLLAAGMAVALHFRVTESEVAGRPAVGDGPGMARPAAIAPPTDSPSPPTPSPPSQAEKAEALLVMGDAAFELSLERIAEKNGELARQLETMSAVEIRELMESLQRAGVARTVVSSQVDLIFKAWAKRDGEAALKFLQTQREAGWAIEGFFAVVEFWDLALLDQAEAVAVAIPATEPWETRINVWQRLLCREIATFGWPAAIEHIDRASDPALRHEILQALTHKWKEYPAIGADVEPTLRWLAERADDESLVHLMFAMAEGKNIADNAAAQILAAPGTKLDRVAQLLVARLAGQNPESALSLCDRFPNRAEVHSMQVLILREWVSADPEAARHWMDRQTVPVEVRNAVMAEP